MALSAREPLTLRVPPGMRDRIRRRATTNGRSMNAEAVICLGRALAAEENEGPVAGGTAPSPITRNPSLGETDEHED